MRYYAPKGGLPPQSDDPNDHAVFTHAYAVIPARSLSDITASFLPGWDLTRLWVLARPLGGFAETFSHYIMEVSPGGGAPMPEPDAVAEGVIFVVSGSLTLSVDGETHELAVGGYAYLPAGCDWSAMNTGNRVTTFHWIRKRYDPAPGHDAPGAFVTHVDRATTVEMPDTGGRWSTTRFVDPADLSHDMHVNIVNFLPGGRIPFMETHVMEHGLYVLEGTAEYKLNRDWVTVGPGDYMWLRAFCPQACIATGDGPFRYLLYKDVNRHAVLTPYGT